MRPLNENDWIETVKNLADLGRFKAEAYDQECIDMTLSLLAFFRGRQLDRERNRQETAWAKRQDQGESSPLFIVLLCVAASAVVATMLQWHWMAALLAAGVCGVSWMVIKSDGGRR